MWQNKATASQHNKAADVLYLAEGRERTQQRQQYNKANDVPYLAEGRERTQQRLQHNKANDVPYLAEGFGLFITKHTTIITIIRRRNEATMTVHHMVLKNPAKEKNRHCITIFLDCAVLEEIISDEISIGNSMICSDIWHIYHE